MSTTKKPYLSKEAVNALKLVSILLVIRAHVGSFYNLRLIFGLNATVGVSTFLILSGYGLSISSNNNLIRRLVKLFIPFLVIQIPCILIYMWQAGIRMSITTLLYFLGLYPRQPYDTTMWFFTYIIFWYIVHYVYLKFNRNKVILVLAVVIAYIPLYYLFQASSGMKMYPIFFPFGCILYEFEHLFQRFNNRLTLLLLAVLFIIGNVFFGYDSLIFVWINSLVTFMILYCLVIPLSNRFNKVFIFLNKHFAVSYYMYLVEGLMIYRFDLLSYFNFNCGWFCFLVLIIVAAKGYEFVIDYLWKHSKLLQPFK